MSRFLFEIWNADGSYTECDSNDWECASNAARPFGWRVGNFAGRQIGGSAFGSGGNFVEVATDYLGITAAARFETIAFELNSEYERTGATLLTDRYSSLIEAVRGHRATCMAYFGVAARDEWGWGPRIEERFAEERAKNPMVGLDLLDPAAEVRRLGAALEGIR